MTRNFLYVLIGGAIGAAVVWFTASKTGEENRLMLRDTLTDAQHKTSTVLDEAQSKASMLVEGAQTKARQITNIGRRVVEEQKSSLEQGAEEIKSAVKSSE